MSLAARARKGLFEPFLAAVFPSRCPCCAGEASPMRGALCEACWAALPVHAVPACPCGGRPASAKGACPRCRRGLTPFRAGASLGPFEDPLRTAIHELKGRGRRRVAARLAEAMLRREDVRSILDAGAVLVPVPLHPQRRRERGFNQSELLATELGRRAGLAVAEVLVRRKDTAAQAGLSGAARRTNVAGAFAARGKGRVAGRVAVLVDDVFTTGATAMACARVLAAAGAAEVRVLTAARVVPRRNQTSMSQQPRKLLPVAALAAAITLVAGPARAWGPIAHQAVNAHAIDTLPKGVKQFYKNHRLELPSLSPEAVVPEEGTDRRFAIDRLMPFPFADVPHTEVEMKAKFGEVGEKAGRLPWLIEESYQRLVDAFKANDKNRILAESDQLAGLVADLHNPLALSDNADGQKTEQHGLWARFTTRLPEAMQNRLKLDPDAAHYLDHPRDYVFAMINDSYVWLDNLLYQEDLAHRGQGGYTELYYEMFEQRAGRILRDRLSQAAGDVGSYWYSAWTAAGRPELR